MPMGDTLVSKGVISADQLKTALEEQKKTNEKLGELLIKLGFTTHDKIEAAMK